MPVLAPSISLRWSEDKINRVTQSLERISEGDFLHWTQKAELYAARGDTEAARSTIEYVIENWGQHHASNDHFLTEIVIAGLLACQFDIANEFLMRRLQPDWQFEFLIADGVSVNPFVIEWEIVSRAMSVFRFDTAVYRYDQAHDIFLQWVWSYRLFDAYHHSRTAITGRTLVSFGDLAAASGLAFSADRLDAFLVPDCMFLHKFGYRDAIARLEQNRIAWAERQPVLFWRGTTTGIRPGDWRTLQRINLCQAAREAQHPEMFDVGVSSVSQLNNPEWIAEIESSDLMRPFVPADLFGNYKYLVDIDGNSSSWEGLFLKLYTGSPVVKVGSRSGFRQWYYDELKPWVNYVPVAADMADLAENVAWLRAHDEQAELIGRRGRALTQTLTYEAELARAAQTIAASINFHQDPRRLAGG